MASPADGRATPDPHGPGLRGHHGRRDPRSVRDQTQMRNQSATGADTRPETALVEQLESVQAVEAGRRRDLLKFQPGTTSGNDASAHDDLAVALSMLISMAWQGLGRSALPEAFRSCYRAASVRGFDLTTCYLLARIIHE